MELLVGVEVNTLACLAEASTEMFLSLLIATLLVKVLVLMVI